MKTDRRAFLAAMASLMMARPGMASAPDGDGDAAIVEALRGSLKEFEVPGLTGGIAIPGQPTRVGAVGLRKIGAPESFTAGDLVHLGSDTKAMTATMIATLVEEGKLSWSSTLGEILPESEMKAEFRPVTLDQLLTHRAGLPANGPWHRLGRGNTTAQRKQLLRIITSKPPELKPGTTFLYSNVGYALAGLMAEVAAGKSWEDLMHHRLFRPLGMTTAGFGVPGRKGMVDQPWGHHLQGEKLVPVQGDNAAALGPAGTVHCTMEDWAKFLNLHVKGARGEETPILKPESFRDLQTPPEGGHYAKGWGIAERPWAGGKVLTHSGSNTMWFCVAWLAPEKGFALFAATNRADDPGTKSTDHAVASMIKIVASQDET